MGAAAGLPVVWDESYELDIGIHVFPTRKYRAIRDRLVAEGTITADALNRPEPATDEQIALVHTAEYMQKLLSDRLTREDELVLEVPYSPELRRAMWLCTGGSILTAQLALEQGLAVHLGGGFHHAFPDHGEGFCLINDVAVAVRVLRADGAIRRAAVIDCDLHQGNGTAAIFRDEPEIYTFSMHQQDNYPLWKPASDHDLGLADGTGDTEYLRLLEDSLGSILEDHEPDLVYYLAGADPYREDQLGGLELTLQGLRKRDESVLARCAARRTPVAVALAGGYALHFEDTVEIHCNTVRVAANRFAQLHG